MNNPPINEREARALDMLIAACLLPPAEAGEEPNLDIAAAMRGAFPIPEGVSLNRVYKALSGLPTEPSPPRISLLPEAAFALYRKAPLHRVLVWSVLLAGVMGTAYMLGRSQGSMAPVAKAPAKGSVTKGPTLVFNNSGPLSPVMDPAKTLAELAKLPPGQPAETAYRSFFEDWASSDPTNAPLAAAAALAFPDGPDRAAALDGVDAGWALIDPQAALDWAAALPATDSAVLRETLIDASWQDPKLAAQYLDKLTAASDRNAGISAIAKAMSQTDPASALAWLDQVAVGATYGNALKGIFASLAQHDPATGANLLANLTTQVDRNAAIAQLARSWSGTDPLAALSWVQTLPDSDGAARDAALNSIVASLSKSDLADAFALVQNSNDPTLLIRVAPTLATAMAQLDPQAALDWTNTLPNGPAKDLALSNVLVSLSQSDFPTAWSDATALPGGSGRDGAMGSLVSSLAKQDPAQAATLLPEFDTVAASLGATQAVAANWVKQDPRAVSVWINTLPAGSQRDTAVVPMITAQTTQDPATALAWATTIVDGQIRNQQILTIIKKWGNINPAAAANAVQSLSNISDTVRASLMINLVKTKGGSK
jgi:hypothetical protein